MARLYNNVYDLGTFPLVLTSHPITLYLFCSEHYKAFGILCYQRFGDRVKTFVTFDNIFDEVIGVRSPHLKHLGGVGMLPSFQ